MEKAQHTPGPWIVSTSGNVISENDKGGDCLVARLSVSSVAARKLEKRANARLIAAAPDLLRELASAVEMIEYEQRKWGHDDRFCEWLISAHAVIVKAESK